MMGCHEKLPDTSDTEQSRCTTADGSRDPSPVPTLAEDQKTDSSLGKGFKKVKIDPRPRPGPSTSHKWKAIHQPLPNKTTDMEDLFESDTEST